MGSRKRRDSFTVISNIPLRDPDLSLKAKGLFCVIRSLPDDWEYSLRGLSHICVEGIDAIREGVKELERAGYLHRERSRKSNGKYLDYICVNEMGQRLKPNTLSAGFKRMLKKAGLRDIRLHDLRHSCASLLLANGVPMKQIQEWLGHSDFSTTANIYAHLDYQSKVSSAEAMLAGLGMGS